MDYSGASPHPRDPLISLPIKTRADITVHPCAAGQEARAAVQGARRARVPLYPARELARAGRAPRAVAPEPARALPALRRTPRAGAEGRAARGRARASAPADLGRDPPRARCGARAW